MISEVFAFENDLLHLYAYPSALWTPTCTSSIESTPDSLSWWLKLERDTADYQVTEITQNHDAWELWPGTGDLGKIGTVTCGHSF